MISSTNQGRPGQTGRQPLPAQPERNPGDGHPCHQRPVRRCRHPQASGRATAGGKDKFLYICDIPRWIQCLMSYVMCLG